MQRINRELKTCAKLKHPNILPVHGYTSGFGPFMAIVSPWAENGNLVDYLEREHANLPIIGRFRIVTRVSMPLTWSCNYSPPVHANNVIHGDFTGPNVLIHGDGTACLADFGLSLMYSDIVSVSQASWTSTFHGNLRWLAPELLGQPGNDLLVCLRNYQPPCRYHYFVFQVLTSKIPYYYLSERAVIRSIYTGERPDRSRYPVFSDKHWRFIEECWSTAAQDRPSTERVVEMIREELDLLSSSSAEFFCIEHIYCLRRKFCMLTVPLQIARWRSAQLSLA
ncbi:kinase-like protein [Rhizopogon vinicolor AM-OR11-026]|uniref:Kinase-like protein n=1 Tax=Rhizopogon vinicolor AM-OR11-026 TaxID=1314800 RepID=A0A1B7N154_9AGAM|nr:kinase-like protein [Rhizopogon vinicolor AM-OR11-026]